MLEEIIGFTGPSHACPSDTFLLQEILLEIALEYGRHVTIVTGACIGIDALVARLASALYLSVLTIVPAYRGKVDPEWRQYCTTSYEMPEGSTFRDRNTYLVQCSTYLIACFRNRSEEALRTGEGMTLRIAYRLNVPTTSVYLHERIA